MNNIPQKRKYTPHGEARKFFVEKISNPSDNCILWQYHVRPNGYGSIVIEKKKHSVHRLALIETTRKPEPHEYALHSCGNRSCFNPKHLRWGTHIDNMNDRRRDGTVSRGESHYYSRLKEKDVVSIIKDSRTSREIAESYGVTKSCIEGIKSGRKWKHIDRSSL